MNEHAVAAALIESGRLDERQALDREAVQQALGAVIADWARRWAESA